MIPVRFAAMPLVVREFPNAGANLAHRDCPACDQPLAGRPVSLVYIGPGADPEDQDKARAGRWHTGAAVAVHTTCAGGPEHPQAVPA